MNKYGGVIGIFNCQGAWWCKSDKKYTIHDLNPDAISGSVRGADVERLADAAPDGWDGDCAVLSHRSCELIRIPRHAALPVTLQKLEYELFTVAPVKVCLLPPLISMLISTHAPWLIVETES
jgi:raffinose synthase